MSKLKDSKSNVLGSIAAMQTLLERYPVLTTTDSMLTNFSVNTSVGFLLDILTVFGVSQTDLIKWVSKILTGTDEEDGLLFVIEHAVKAILLANIKDMWSCSVDPILPDCLMKYVNCPSGCVDPYEFIPEDLSKYKKIEIDLNQVDMFGLLNNCPSDEGGSVFYFDTDYTPNNLWKSRDFNAYLWYIINKGTLSNKSDLQRSCWDNRNKYTKKFKEDSDLKENFFNISNFTGETGSTIIVTGNTNNIVEKRQILLCEFNERPTPTQGEETRFAPSSNVLRVWINANRYYKTNKIGNFNINKTVFEFNYDYIYSLKLFDSKTLVAQILNSLLGLSASLSASFSVEQKMVEAKISEIIKKVIEADDTASTNCYYKFSNDEYDAMLNEATQKYNGVYQTNKANGSYGRIDSEKVLESLRNLKQSDNLIEQQSNIARTLEEVMVTVASPASITEECKFSFGLNFIKDFIQQTVTQIVLQVLTPKVAILYQINAAIMGSEVDNLKSWEDFMRNFQNVLLNVIRQIKDIIVEELYKYVMEKLQPLLSLMIEKIALETVMYYKELIEQLLLSCVPNLSLSKNMVIDNVNYADITTEATPEDYNNNTKC